MTNRRLPPLNALRGFDAAARHLSFTRAADELRLTQGAVSRQVRDVEVFLGQPLFRRYTRRIELTAEGAELHRVVQDLFDELERATRRFTMPAGRERTLTISALPTIASMWLMPRLHRFTQANAGIEVRIASSIEPANLRAPDLHMAIRVGRLPGRLYNRLQPRIELEMLADWEGVQADLLFPDVLVPVCSPTLTTPGIATAEAVARLPLIHTSTRRYAWPDWLRAQGVRAPEGGAKPIEFGHFFMSLEAARRGQGVAIIPDVILEHYEGGGELVCPLTARVPSAGEYYLLTHKNQLGDPKAKLFRSWLLSEADAARPSK